MVTLISVLIALEANAFVLTTTSNLSRLIDELRKNVVDPRYLIPLPTLVGARRFHLYRISATLAMTPRNDYPGPRHFFCTGVAGVPQ